MTLKETDLLEMSESLPISIVRECFFCLGRQFFFFFYYRTTKEFVSQRNNFLFSLDTKRSRWGILRRANSSAFCVKIHCSRIQYLKLCKLSTVDWQIIFKSLSTFFLYCTFIVRLLTFIRLQKKKKEFLTFLKTRERETLKSSCPHVELIPRWRASHAWNAKQFSREESEKGRGWTPRVD